MHLRRRSADAEDHGLTCYRLDASDVRLLKILMPATTESIKKIKMKGGAVINLHIIILQLRFMLILGLRWKSELNRKNVMMYRLSKTKV